MSWKSRRFRNSRSRRSWISRRSHLSRRSRISRRISVILEFLEKYSSLAKTGTFETVPYTILANLELEPLHFMHSDFLRWYGYKIIEQNAPWGLFSWYLASCSQSAPESLLFKQIPAISRLLRNNPDRIISPAANIFCAVNKNGYLVNVSQIMKQFSCQVFIVTHLKGWMKTACLQMR